MSDNTGKLSEAIKHVSFNGAITLLPPLDNANKYHIHLSSSGNTKIVEVDTAVIEALGMLGLVSHVQELLDE